MAGTDCPGDVVSSFFESVIGNAAERPEGVRRMGPKKEIIN
jgi:hypothetical protein